MLTERLYTKASITVVDNTEVRDQALDLSASTHNSCGRTEKTCKEVDVVIERFDKAIFGW